MPIAERATSFLKPKREINLRKHKEPAGKCATATKSGDRELVKKDRVTIRCSEAKKQRDKREGRIHNKIFNSKGENRSRHRRHPVKNKLLLPGNKARMILKNEHCLYLSYISLLIREMEDKFYYVLTINPSPGRFHPQSQLPTQDSHEFGD